MPPLMEISSLSSEKLSILRGILRCFFPIVLMIIEACSEVVDKWRDLLYRSGRLTASTFDSWFLDCGGVQDPCDCNSEGLRYLWRKSRECSEAAVGPFSN